MGNLPPPVYEGAAAWLPLLEQGSAGSAFPASMHRVILHCWQGPAGWSVGPLPLCVPQGGTGAGCSLRSVSPELGECARSWWEQDEPPALLPPPQVQPNPRSSKERSGKDGSMREGMSSPSTSITCILLHPNSSPTTKGFSLAMEKFCCGFSNYLNSGHESCWAFLWEMKTP